MKLCARRIFSKILYACALLIAFAATANAREFTLSGVTLDLQEVTSQADVYYTSMRLNRALNVWNVEVTISNKSAQVFSGPIVLLVEGFSGTSGPQQTDGTIEGNKGFFDMSALTQSAALLPGQKTGKRTLTLGVGGGGSPSLITKIYAGQPPAGTTLAVTRSLDDVGRPLPSVEMQIAGPAGSDSHETDKDSGVASFGQGAGAHTVKFSLGGYLPVWRQKTLSLDGTTVVPNPRLTKRSSSPFNVTPLSDTVVSNASGGIQIIVPAGAASQNGTLTLTPLTGQSLPAFLPLGWSPLCSFWIESTSPLQSPLSATLRPAGPISGNETAALVRWNEAGLQWVVVQTIGGNGTNAVNVVIPGEGAYALVAGDTGELSPPSPQVNQALSGSSVSAIDVASFTATGSVTPPSSPASTVPELVTGTANVVLKHSTRKLPSGYLLRGEVTETYLLSDGSLRLTPQYEHFIVGYQRPGDQDLLTLHASFPMRPLLLFGSDQLDSATVRVDVLNETPFDGQVLDETGGQIGSEGVRLLAGSGRLTSPSALRLRRLDSTVFTNLVGQGHTVVAAFDLTVDSSTIGEALATQLAGAPANGRFVLARLLSDTGFYGLQPIERLQSDAQGNLQSLEPTVGERLPGLRGSGQFVLIQVELPQGLVSGVARNGQGALQAGMPVRLSGLPWLTLTDAQGYFQLVSPVGERDLGVTDPMTGDTGFTEINVTDPASVLVQGISAAPSGPRVSKITPAHNALRVPRVGSVVIEFNEAVNPASVIGSAIQLLRTNDSVVPAVLTLNLANTIATLSPATELDADTIFRVRLATNIADPGGLPIEGQTEFSFRTVPLSTRDPAAQLIIYEPGAKDVPPEVLAQIPAYEPGEDPSAIVVRGTPGTADPEVPVILVNESSGETATVLSKPDGSFASVISGTEEDFVSATFVNLNGTRVYVPVSRQEFDNGFVGLYRSGGILEAVSDGGPVRVYIQPEAIKTKAKLRINTLSAAQLQQLTGGVTPELGTAAAQAMKIQVEGPLPTEPMQISFPVNLAEVGYPADESPTNVAAMLVAVRDIQGTTAYEFLDQMYFQPQVAEPSPFKSSVIRPTDASDVSVGTMITALGFIPSPTIGLVTPLVVEYIVMPLIVGNRPVVVKGITQHLPEAPASTADNAIEAFSEVVVNALTESFNSQFIVNPVPGAFVILRDIAYSVYAAPGRLQPGNVYTTSGANGAYSMVAPQASKKYLVMATHPGYSDQPAAEVRASVDIGLSGAVFKRLIFHTLNAGDAPLTLNVSHVPVNPAPGQDCELQIAAFRGSGMSPEMLVRVLAVTNLTAGTPATIDDAVLTNITISSSGITRLWRGTLSSAKPVQVVLKIVADGEHSNYTINFSGTPPPPVVGTDLPVPDTNDVHGPIVISTLPAEGNYVGVDGEITILFNKPIDRRIEESFSGVTLNGPFTTARPILRLDGGQKILTVQYAGLSPDEEYTLTLNSQAVRDLAGQPLDQRPSTPEPDSFVLRFRTSPVRNTILSELVTGRGAIIHNQHLFVLEAGGQGSSLLTYDIRDPSFPILKTRTRLYGQPRDFVLIPKYPHKLHPNESAVTNDLLVVVGGDLDSTIDEFGNSTVRGQYLNVFNVADPVSPVSLANAIVSYRISSAVTKVRWSAPHLIYHEYGQDIQQLALVNLQELIVGFSLPGVQGEFRAGRQGVDLNGDGDYVDADEVVPIPEFPPAEFYGKKFAYLLSGTTQKILDFSPLASGQMIGVTLTRGQGRGVDGKDNSIRYRPSYRTLAFDLNTAEPANAAYAFGDAAYPRWVEIFASLPILSNNVPLQPRTALVSLQPDDAEGQQMLAVLDISLPLTPRLINKIPISSDLLGGSMQSVHQRDDGLLELAGSQHIVLLDSLHFGVTNVVQGQAHPAIVGYVPFAGAGSRTLGTSDYGYHSVADGGRGSLIQTPPLMRFVNFPASPAVVKASELAAMNETLLLQLADTMRAASAIPPARAKAKPSIDIESDLNPPRPASHFHVYVEAPGTSGKTIELGLESVNHAGRPLANFGVGFAPVRAISDSAQEQIGQKPRPGCGATINSLTAWRMSDNPESPFYNRYLSRAFALVANEQLSTGEISDLKAIVDREILYSGAGLRAFIDPSQSGNNVVGLFAAKVDGKRKLILPIAQTEALTLYHPYIMGDNPPPAGGYVALPATYGMVAAHSGEVRTEAADMELPSPRMPIAFQRSIGNQDVYEGPLGVGWDFNYNQRITELNPISFPLGLQMPLIVRGTKADSEIAGSQDVLFNTGMGRILRFRWVSTDMPPEYENDPLVGDFGYASRVLDYYLPAKGQGVFDLLVKFKDGRFERLTPDGVRYRYAANGRLETIIDRFPLNKHVLEYDRNGWLIRIDDKSVKSPRYLEIGHYRMANDPDFREGLDERTTNGQLDGKIHRLRNYAGGDVMFYYTDDGFLIRREGIQVNGENEGFSGRAHTHYTYKNCRFAGVSVTKNGTPLFTADTVENSAKKPVIQSGTGIGGSVGINIPIENSAATLENQKSSADLADSSNTEFEFDKLGHLKSMKSSGDKGAAAVSVPAQDEDGLVMSIRHPEGNSEVMTYDSQNPIFRSRGNLLKHQINPGPRGGQGYSLEFVYDPRYNLKSGVQRDANGFAITYTLRADKRELESIQYGSAGRDEYTYDDNGQLLTSKDTQGVINSTVYRSDNAFVQTRSSGNSTYTYGYDGGYAALLGQSSTITMPEGLPVQMKYNRRLQTVENSRGDLKELSGYDEQGRVVFRKQFLGDGKSPISRWEFDQKGFLKRNTTEGVEVRGNPTTLEYIFTPDELSRIKSVQLPQGTLQVHEFDNRGNIVRRTVGDYVEEYTVDLNGNTTEVRKGGDLVESVLLDGLDRPVTITRHTGDKDEVIQRTYFAGGQPKSEIITDDEFGPVKQFNYDQIDELGRPVSMVVAGTTIHPEYSYIYEPNAMSETGPRMTLRRTWDDGGHPLGRSTAILTEKLTPDGNGRVRRVERIEDGASYNDYFEYDGLDNQQSYRDDLGPVYQYVARADGKLSRVTNARDNATVMDHSAKGELLRKRRADGMEVRHQHDELRHTLFTGDPQAGFQSDYDTTIRLESSTQRNGGVTTFGGFDSRRQPQSVTIPGGSITMLYDLKERLIERTINFQSTAYAEVRTYDALDRLRSIKYRQDAGAENTATYDYDLAGPLLSARHQEDGADFLVQYEYYGDRTRKTIRYPSGAVVTEHRDNAGRLTAVSDQGGTIIRATAWQGNEQPKVIDLGPMNIVKQYDTRGRLTASRATRVGDGAVLAHMRYKHDAANNLEIRQFLHRGGRADGFSYDNGERVSAAKIGALPTSPQSVSTPLYERGYTYEAGGLDYLTSVSNTNLGLSPPPFASTWSDHDAFLLPGKVDGFDRAPADPKGNVQFAILPVRPSNSDEPAQRSVSLLHNGNGNLVRVEREDGVIEENFYQPDGLRYRRLVSNGPQVLDHRHFVYDSASRLLEEYDLTTGSPYLVARYFYASSDVPEAADLYNYSTGQTNRYFFLRDNLESVIAVVDADGDVVERAWYDTFGQPALERKDTRSPVLKSVVAGEDGSLLIALSESVMAPFSDPGAGTGIVPVPMLAANGVVGVSINSSNIAGTVELLPSLEGHAPFSVLKFVPSESLPTTPTGLLGWWPSDLNVSDVAAGNNGALRSGATLGAGLIQQAFALNGTSAYVEITNAAAVNFGAGDFTVSCWVNFSSTSGEQVLIEKWTQSTSSGWSLVRRADQRLSLVLGNGAGAEFTIQSSGPLALATNTWVQIAARRQGNQFTIFTNGTTVATGSQTVTLTSPSTLKFGSREGTSLFLNGRIDEVTLFSRALSDQEIVSVAGGVAVPGPVTLTLNADKLADEWSNLNDAAEVSFMLVDDPGTVFYSAQPDPETEASRLARSSVGSPILFHGQYFDYDTGLVYLRARFYDPFAGMFLEPDPLGYEDSVNHYAGMGNNPVGYRDPTGLGTVDGILRTVFRAGSGVASRARGAVQGERKAASLFKPSILNTGADAKSQSFWLSRAAEDAKAFREPLEALHVKKFGGSFGHLDEALRPVVLGQEKTIVGTAKLTGAIEFMEAGMNGRYMELVTEAITSGRKLIVDVSRMGGKSVAARIENSIARRAAFEGAGDKVLDGMQAPFCTDWEMLRLWEHGALGRVTFVERVGDDIYELANPFLKATASARFMSAATSSVAAARRFGGQLNTLAADTMEVSRLLGVQAQRYGITTGARFGIAVNRGYDNFVQEPDQFQIP